MLHLYRALIVAASDALAAGAAIAGDADETLFAANQAVMRPAAQTSPRSAAPNLDITLVQGQEPSAGTYGADPDPSKFDRAGLEIWWAKYSKAHPGD